MDRKYLEENLSAFLDGELPSEMKRQFETELAKHPDLLERADQIRKLTQLSKSGSVDLPAEGYFDGLAERIDARLAKEEAPAKESLLIRILRPKPRVAAAFGTLAAIFLVVVIANRIFSPTTEHIAPSTSGRLSPAPSVEHPAVLDSTVFNDEARTEKKSLPLPKQSNASKQVQGKAEDKQPNTTEAEDKFEILGTPAFAPVPDTVSAKNAPAAKLKMAKPEKSQSFQMQLEEKDIAPMQSLPAPSQQVVTASREFNPDITLQQLLPLDSTGHAIDDPDTIASAVSALLTRGQYLRTSSESDQEVTQGAYKPAKPQESALAKRADESPLLNLDSLRNVDPKQWRTELQFREAMKTGSLADVITARVYVELYLQNASLSSQDMWLARLDSLRKKESVLRQDWKKNKAVR